MRKFIKNLSLILFFSSLLIPFNNCSYIDTSVFSADQGSLTNGSPTIQANVPNSIRIASDTQLFTIQGSCSLGIYSDANIYWTLNTLNEQPVSDSFGAGGPQFFATCINNLFSIEVRVPCPGLINVAQDCFGLLAPLNLRLRIQGLSATGAEVPNAIGTSSTITISP